MTSFNISRPSFSTPWKRGTEVWNWSSTFHYIIRNYKKQPYLETLSIYQYSWPCERELFKEFEATLGKCFLPRTVHWRAAPRQTPCPNTLVCRALQGTVPDHLVQYRDVFSACQETQDTALDTFTLRMEARERILEAQRTGNIGQTSWEKNLVCHKFVNQGHQKKCTPDALTIWIPCIHLQSCIVVLEQFMETINN